MAEEKKDTELNEEKLEAGTEKKDENQPEKKYTDDDVNSISKKNSEKAVKKMLKELGITDTEKAKQILAKAAKEEKPDETTGTTAEDAEKLAQVEKLRSEAVSARIENVLLSSSVKPEKVERAVKLIDVSECLDEDGEFDKGKAAEAVKALLKDWPELVSTKADESAVGFQIGADGTQNGKPENKGQNKKPVQKSWNRFN